MVRPSRHYRSTLCNFTLIVYYIRIPEMQPAGQRTELIWEGKYEANGKRVAPLRVQLPFQNVEMVNESAQERQRALSLFESPGAYLAKEWRNRLIWGDKKYVLPALLQIGRAHV